MGEIITIQVGQCGNVLGKQFWETICSEHGVNKVGAFLSDNESKEKNLSVYFREVKGMTYVPRAVMIDLDRRTMDLVRYSNYGQIFNPNNFVFSTDGTGNNWAKGHFSEGADLCFSAIDVIRKEAEVCDHLREFEIVHSIGGGTGAGLGSLLICKLKDEYPKKLMSTYSVIPSPKVSDFVVEPYNAVLTLQHLIDNTNKTFCMDNEALFHITNNNLGLNQAKICEVNALMSCAMAGITSCVRFPGSLNVGYKKFAVNAIPFPRFHFFVPGMTPILRRDNKFPRKSTTADIVSGVFDNQNFLAACDMNAGIYLTATYIFRGALSTREVEKHMYNLKIRNSSRFVEWIPNNLKISFCNVPPPGFTGAATIVANTTAIQDIFKRIEDQFKKMFNKKAYIHWYTGEGMDLLEFEAADAALHELIEDYDSMFK